jgi:hypothetical protein
MVMREAVAVSISLLMMSVFVSALEVKSAKRVEKYADSSAGTEVTPPSSTDVVLVVELTGISVEEFDAIPKNQIVVTAGERRFDAQLTLNRDWFMVDGDRRPVGGVQEDRRIVVIVPRDVLDFSLRFGEGSVVTFKADPDIGAFFP